MTQMCSELSPHCQIFFVHKVICTEKDAMKGQLARKEKEFRDRERKLQGNLRLMQHQAKEKEALLNEQVQALKDSIKQLAEVRNLEKIFGKKNI